MRFYDRLLRKARLRGLVEFSKEDRKVQALVRASTRLRRRPPEAGIAVPAILPHGPLPLLGGAEAPLNFERD